MNKIEGGGSIAHGASIMSCTDRRGQFLELLVIKFGSQWQQIIYNEEAAILSYLFSFFFGK